MRLPIKLAFYYEDNTDSPAPQVRLGPAGLLPGFWRLPSFLSVPPGAVHPFSALAAVSGGVFKVNMGL